MKAFRPIQDSIAIVVKMLAVAEYYGNQSEIDYWTHRLNGYMKLASQKGIVVKREDFLARIEEE